MGIGGENGKDHNKGRKMLGTRTGKFQGQREKMSSHNQNFLRRRKLDFRRDEKNFSRGMKGEFVTWWYLGKNGGGSKGNELQNVKSLQTKNHQEDLGFMKKRERLEEIVREILSLKRTLGRGEMFQKKDTKNYRTLKGASQY